MKYFPRQLEMQFFLLFDPFTIFHWPKSFIKAIYWFIEPVFSLGKFSLFNCTFIHPHFFRVEWRFYRECVSESGKC